MRRGELSGGDGGDGGRLRRGWWLDLGGGRRGESDGGRGRGFWSGFVGCGRREYTTGVERLGTWYGYPLYPHLTAHLKTYIYKTAVHANDIKPMPCR